MADCDIKITFDKIKEIGQEGKNSKVYLVHDHQLDGDLVIKEISKANFKTPDEYFKEARIMFAQKHENVVEVHYAGMDADNIYIAMPFYANGSMKHLISNNHFLTIHQVLRYATQFLTGLNHIHSRGLLHLDIKPDNIMLSNSDVALLSDFGLAKYTDVYGLADQTFAYSMHRAPEQMLTRLRQSRLTDIYQVGVTLYRMVNGNEFFYGQTKGITTPADFQAMVIKGKFPFRDSYQEHVPQKLRRIINKCMTPNPTKRYDNALELLNDLASVTENLNYLLHFIAPATKEWTKLDNGHELKIQRGYDGAKYTVRVMKEAGGCFQNQKRYNFVDSDYSKVCKHLSQIFAEYDG